MGLEELHIPGTKFTPDINFKPNGVLKIKGRGFKIFNNHTSREIFSWLKFYVKEPSEVTSVMLAFEYLNTVSTNFLDNILQTLLKVQPSKILVIYWYYEHDDLDMLERGEHISQTLNLPFTFIDTQKIDWQYPFQIHLQ